MVNRLSKRFPWLPLYLVVGMMCCLVASFMYALWVEPVPYREVYSAPTAHDGSGTTRTTLKFSPAFAPGDFFYSYREYCMSKTVERIYLRRWLSGTDANNSDVVFAYELQLIVPMAGKEGCHNISMAIEAPAIKNGRYLLHTQVVSHTNALRADVIDLSPVQVTILGESIGQRDARQELAITELRKFDAKVVDWMEKIDVRLTRLRGELALHRIRTGEFPIGLDKP